MESSFMTQGIKDEFPSKTADDSYYFFMLYLFALVFTIPEHCY